MKFLVYDIITLPKHFIATLTKSYTNLEINSLRCFGLDYLLHQPCQMDFGQPTSHTKELQVPTNQPKTSNLRLVIFQERCNLEYLKYH